MRRDHIDIVSSGSVRRDCWKVELSQQSIINTDYVYDSIKYAVNILD